jgi:hypothetical protein
MRYCGPGQVYLSKPILDRMWVRFSDLPSEYRPRSGECVRRRSLGWMVEILRRDVQLSAVDQRRARLARRYAGLRRALEERSR